jgi:CDP-diacylglycerol--serine O-phosphatidyltransferase
MSHLFAPFQPDSNEPRRRRFKPIPVRMLIPNLITLFSLCLGLTAIRMAVDGKFELAITSIVIAGVLDGIDGRIARLLHSTSRFGAELDSLADFVSFGVAPALILYFWGLNALHSAGWIAVLVFAICAGLRLARFNVSLDDPNKPPYAVNFFTGVPAPAGAGLVLFPMFAWLAFRDWGWVATADVIRHPALAAVMLFVVGGLMVSTLPSWSFKNFKIPAERVLPLFLGVGGFLAFLVTEPWAALALAGMIYIGMLWFSARSFQRLKREAEMLRGPEAVETGRAAG